VSIYSILFYSILLYSTLLYSILQLIINPEPYLSNLFTEGGKVVSSVRGGAWMSEDEKKALSRLSLSSLELRERVSLLFIYLLFLSFFIYFLLLFKFLPYDINKLIINETKPITLIRFSFTLAFLCRWYALSFAGSPSATPPSQVG
jgi:uncharacterized membrane protein